MLRHPQRSLAKPKASAGPERSWHRRPFVLLNWETDSQRENRVAQRSCRQAGLLLILLLSIHPVLIAQKDEPAQDMPSIASRTIDLSHTEALTGLPNNNALSYSPLCSSRGVIYSNVRTVTPAGSPVQVAELYAADEQRKVTKLDLELPSDYKQSTTRQFYPSEHRVVVLLQSSQPVNSNEILAPGHTVPFLSLLDLDTGEKTLFRLDLDFQVVKAAIFASGTLLVIGVDRASETPVLALLHEDGTLDQKLDLAPEDMKASPQPRFRQPDRDSDSTAEQVETRGLQVAAGQQRLQLARTLNAAQFVPWGSSILMVVPGPMPHIYKVRDSGEHDLVRLKLPDSAQLLRVLGTGEKDSWVVAARSGGGGPGGQRRGSLDAVKNVFFEVDPFTGTVIDQLTVTGPQPTQVMCAADGRLAALYLGAADPSTGQQVLGYASAPR